MSNNLILHPDGTLTCKDGQNVQEYLRKHMKEAWNSNKPEPVALLHWSRYSDLVFRAGLIMAA